MAEEKYIWCRNCNELHHVNPFDKAPVYLSSRGEVTETAMDDWREFMRRHAGHRLEGLTGVGQKYFPSGQPMGPMRTGYVEVTNGRECFVVRSSRKDIQQPRHFELIRGRLRAIGESVDIQENEIKKEMKHHFSWAPSERPDDEKIDLFVRLLKEVVKDLNPYEIRVSEFDDWDSSIAYGLLEPPVIEALIQKCLPCFNPDELSAIKRFIDSHRAGNDVLAILIKRHYCVEES